MVVELRTTYSEMVTAITYNYSSSSRACFHILVYDITARADYMLRLYDKNDIGYPHTHSPSPFILIVSIMIKQISSHISKQRFILVPVLHQPLLSWY